MTKDRQPSNYDSVLEGFPNVTLADVEKAHELLAIAQRGQGIESAIAIALAEAREEGIRIGRDKESRP